MNQAIHHARQKQRPAVTALDEGFIALLDGFRPTGGMVRAEDLIQRIGNGSDACMGRLGKMIAAQRIVNVRWNQTFWFPVFQFDIPAITPIATLEPVISELIPAFDDWQLAEWFCRPSGWLEDQTPAAAIQHRPAAVCAAARADRFAILG